MILQVVLLLLGSSLPTSKAQGCVQRDAIYVGEATYKNVTVDLCKYYCQRQPECKFFTWNSQTQGCGIRTYDYGGYVDAPTQHSGTPYASGFVSNKLFVGKVTRQYSISECSSSCYNSYYCNSWTWYSLYVANSSNICVQHYDESMLPSSILVPSSSAQAQVPSIYSGLKSCQDSSSGCTSFVNSNLCCPTQLLPFVKNCGFDQSGSFGNIRTPNYPNAYGNAVACVWNINATAGSNITLAITAFQTENYNDRLFILKDYTYSYYSWYYGSCSYANGSYLSGSLNPRTITINQNNVALYFYSDESISYSGFNINWYASTGNNCTSFVNNNICCPQSPFVKNCGADQTGSSGSITSPNFPAPYSSNTSCVWNINAPIDTYIHINITSFFIENFDDRLFILLPQNCSYAVGKYLTGNLNPQSITIPQNTASLYFYSDSSINYSGFNISWTAATNCAAYVNNNSCCPGQMFVKNCGSSLSGASGTLQSPNYPKSYGNNQNCEWTITAPAGKNITLAITDFNTELGFDRLFILRPGVCLPPASSNSSYLSGTPGVMPSIRIGQNTVAIYFYSDSQIVSKGFSINWTT